MFLSEFQLIHIGMPDFTPPTISQVETFIDVVNQAQRDEKVGVYWDSTFLFNLPLNTVDFNLLKQFLFHWPSQSIYEYTVETHLTTPSGSAEGVPDGAPWWRIGPQ